MSTGAKPTEQVRVLTVGRFQPLHLGHMAMLKQAAELGEVVVVVGSAEKSRTEENPFSCRERLEMLKAAIPEAGLDPARFTLVPVEDVHSNEMWVARVEMLTPKFHTVMTGNQLVAQLFRDRGYPIVVPKRLKPRRFKGVRIRKNIASGKSWEKLVPLPVAGVIHASTAFQID